MAPATFVTAPAKANTSIILQPYVFFAVLAERLKFFAVGAPLEPALRILSSEPSAMRLRLA
jgi:hypothetical protein